MTTNGSSITASAALIAVLSLASRILGLVRDRVLAGTFGAGPTLDAYYAAFRIPDFAFNLLGLAALSAAFLPIFIRLRHADPTHASRYASRVLTDLALLLAVLAAIGALAAGSIYGVLAPGFDAAQRAATAEFGRILFLATVLLGVSSVVGGVLQATERFFAFAAAPLLYNLGIIAGVVFLVPLVGPAGIAWGVVLGAAAHLAAQWVAARRVGVRITFDPAWRDPDVRRTARMLLPRILALGAQQVQSLVTVSIASTLAAGSLAAFTLADNIQHVPIALVGVAFAVAAFPRLASAAAARDHAAFRHQFSFVLRQIALLAFPGVVALLALKAQIVRVLLGSGAFGWEDTVTTFRALEAFGYGLIAAMLIPLCTRAFYAHEDTRTPFWCAVISVVVGVTAARVLGRWYGARGLAMASAIGASTNAFLLFATLRWRVGPLDGRRIVRSLATFAAAAFAMGIVIQLVKPGVAVLIGTDSFIGIALQGALAGLFGFITYLTIGVLLHSTEITALTHALHRHILRTAHLPPTGTEEAGG